MTRHPVLDARESRWQNKKKIAEATVMRFPGREVSFAFCTLRMPSSLRMSCQYDGLVAVLQEALRQVLISRGIPVLTSGTEQYVDGPNTWLAADCGAETLKRLAIGIEEEHPQGALVDIDVSDAEGGLLSRRDMGCPARKCLVCDEDAAVCSAGQRHPLSEIADRIERMIPK